MPFGSMHIDPNGQIKICCADGATMLDKHGKPFNVQTHDLKDAWNSDHYKKVRQEFLAGEQPKSCFHCWESEVGNQGKSTRTAGVDIYKKIVSRGFDLNAAIDESKNNNGVLNSSPADFQVMSGNLCNLSCKMCYPRYSNTWSKFYINKNIDIKGLKFHKLMADPQYLYPDFGQEFNWPKIVTMKKIFTDIKDNLYHFNMTGGEPTLLEENIEFIEYLKSSKNFDNLEFMMITNTTNINKKLLNAIKDFKQLIIMSSLDGLDEIAYIQRTPSNWEQVYKNFKILRKFSIDHPNINHGMITTVTALNIHHIGHFWDVLLTDKDNKLTAGEISTHFVVHSNQFVGLGIVPKKSIEKIREEFTQIKSIKNTVLYHRVLNYIDNMQWADDNTAMLEMLDNIQNLHPDLNIKELYRTYYE